MNNLRILIFCVLAISILVFASNVSASNTAFTHTDYTSSTSFPTIDGQYTSATEWQPSKSVTFGTNGLFRNEWASTSDFTKIVENQIIETTDNTDDAGDYWEICFDSNNDGGTAPQTDDFRVTITGHGTTATVAWFKGTGTAWASVASPSATTFNYKESLASWGSVSSSPHYLLEVAIDKQATDLGAVIMGINFGLRVAYNDAHAGGNGLQAWPPAPASRDDPSGWAFIESNTSGGTNPSPDVTPESLTIAGFLVLSSVAVISGTVLLRKRQRVLNLRPIP